MYVCMCEKVLGSEEMREWERLSGPTAFVFFGFIAVVEKLWSECRKVEIDWDSVFESACGSSRWRKGDRESSVEVCGGKDVERCE